jgi:uncharacterized protein YdeI (YjbR/CyaY-like superfamily)
MATLEDLPLLDVADREGWRRWLEEHHGRAQGVRLILARRAGNDAVLTYEAAVEEALCFGWIDGRQQPHDDRHVRQHFAPRRQGGTWARSNRERVERLEREGRMTEAGLRVVEAARRDGSWSFLEDVENLVVPDDLAAALAGDPEAGECFSAFSPSVRRAYLGWIKEARRPATRASRIADTVWLAHRGIREPHRRGPG